MLIRVVDLESTGQPLPDADVIEIGACDVYQAEFSAPKIGAPMSQLVRPTRPILPEASAVHHLIAADLADAPLWDDVLPEFVSGPVDIFAAHSMQLERVFLTDEATGGKRWICTYKCSLRLWPNAPKHSNQALRYWIDLPGLDRATASPAHRGGPDAYVSAHLLAAMLELASPEQLIEWSGEPALLPRIPFGDFRGQPWNSCDDGFLDWVLRRDFSEDVLFTARRELERREKLREEYRLRALTEEGRD